jgi:hypothetical protein
LPCTTTPPLFLNYVGTIALTNSNCNTHNNILLKLINFQPGRLLTQVKKTISSARRSELCKRIDRAASSRRAREMSLIKPSNDHRIGQTPGKGICPGIRIAMPTAIHAHYLLLYSPLHFHHRSAPNLMFGCCCDCGESYLWNVAKHRVKKPDSMSLSAHGRHRQNIPVDDARSTCCLHDQLATPGHIPHQTQPGEHHGAGISLWNWGLQAQVTTPF